MVAYSTTNFTPGTGAYIFTVADLPGVVAANNFLSVFNPTTSGVTHVAQEVAVTTYTIGASSTATSLTAKRITAASGGTLQAVSDLSRFDTVSANPKAQVRTGNPSVTLRTGNVILTVPPPLSTGAGAGALTLATAPAGDRYVLHQGEGLVFGTAAGNTNQVWSITYVWREIAL